ncbi:NAD-dependent epimerase/dehydratase family protein [Geodermatophilus sabuli]|uniref:Nucleoside-diphosphate-sugar epimerase n=1 Tax=Geodermatophilus sabuli TaxID=1564158 RepID=A0A285EBW0_9ACTN|nr:NAD-dependent epimerase/dehydratase family protein [Geodermatophilus sabuli]MBB3085051.1 nucleoside-diphosphate-sugar epimerase [Geodermatophilus sabuli]SNX95541.1 Nucleoside-diphosphate-sugar epimerase [Geodermatophilus sabuli]
MALHVIVGKGPVGTTTAELLAAQGQRVRVLSRSGGTSTDAVEHRAVDASDADALAEAARGAAALYNAVNPAYHRWATDWPPVAAALLSAAERTGAVLVTMSNLYVYGRPENPMSPDSPLAATDVKGRVRIAMWQEALAAHEAGRIRMTEARAADYVGPQVPAARSHLVRQLPTLRRGRRAWVIGDPDAPRSWAYLPDVAATLATLGTDERALGRAWHVPSAPPRSQRQALGDLAAAMSSPASPVPPARVSGIPWPVLRGIGLVSPMMREIVDIRHQFDQEYVIDATATTATFGLTATPWPEVVAATAVAVPATA